tara:strand:+ start:349 stop:552 length:204 start_codon:yes stop_codon:yes gene_type:complete
MLKAFKKTKKQKQVIIIEYFEKLSSLSKNENFITLIFNELSKIKLNIIIIDIMKNFFIANILNLSSI